MGVFLACLVEAVEALTVVLAVGMTRGWRATWQGVAAGLAVLGLTILVLGRALEGVPISALRLVVGALLLVFGLQWLRKAVLRSGGYKPLHNEDMIFAKEIKMAKSATQRRRGVVEDWYAFTVSFKSVLLEGLEVALIVLTFSASGSSIWPAALCAVAAVIVVAIVGAVLRHPLSRVPENALKFGVGVLLTSFGTFWAGEGVGVHWPGADASLLGLVVCYACASAVIVAWLNRTRIQQARPLT